MSKKLSQVAQKLQTAVDLARLALRLGEVERATEHPDGRRETDTTHTVMLAWIAASLCPPDLSTGRVLELALAHDALEALAGDVDTSAPLDEGARRSKAQREAFAMEEIRSTLGPDSWLVTTIEQYEAQEEQEARWVRWLDKVMPRLTHSLNGAAPLARVGRDAEWLRSRNHEQGERLAAALPDVAPDIEPLWSAACRLSEACWRPASTPGAELIRVEVPCPTK